MTARFITTITPASPGFEQATLSRDTDLSGCVVLLAESLDQVRAALPGFENAITGLVVTLKEKASLRKIGRSLWHLEAPASLSPDIRPLTEGFAEKLIETMALHDRVTEGDMIIGKLNAEMASVRRDYDDSVSRLTEQVAQITALKDELQVIFETSQAGIILVDARGIITYANKRMATMFRCAMEELIGSAYPDHVHPDDRQTGSDRMKKLIAGETDHVHVERHYVRCDGTDFWGFLSGRRYEDSDGKLIALVGIIADITDKKLATEALRESEKRMQTMLEANPSPVVAYNARGYPEYLNPAFVELFGWTLDEVKGRHLPFLPDNEKERTRQITKELYATKKPVEFEAKRLTKSGEAVDVIIRAGVLTSDAGEVTGTIVTFTDITEKKKFEKDLRENESMLHATFEAVPDAIVLYDTMGFPRYLNPAFVELFGWTLDELKGKRIPFVPDDQKESSAEVIRNVYATGKDGKFETRRYTKDGRVVDIIINGALVVDQKGSPTGMVVTLTDVTDNKRRDRELRESEERYRTIIDQSSDAIFQGDPKGNFVVVNTAASELTGYPREELLAMNMGNLFSPEEMQREPLRYDLLQTGTTLTRERVITRKSGDPVEVEMSSKRLSNGTYLCAMRSIAERKRAENERIEVERRLLHAQKLESLGVLAGGIAHDFNNLLMAILGNLDLVQMKLPEESTAFDNVKNAVNAAVRAADLTRQMLAYSGKGTFVTKKIDLNELVSEMVHLLKASISKNITFTLSLGKELPVIDADVAQLQQVIMNLIVNASEAIGDSAGAITLTTGYERHEQDELNRSRIVEKLDPGKYVRVTVSDTGCGMDEATRQKLFEPFFTTKFTGRGLGMAAVQGIVQSHKGAIILDSEPGRGSSFTVLLPAADGRRQPPETLTVETAGEDALSGTILVVDDEPEVLNLCAGMLNYLGLETLTAADGIEAVSMFRKHAGAIDCVLLDLTMPRMDGAAAFEQLRTIHQNVRIVLSSGYTQEDVAEKFTGKRVDGFIQKPYTLARLREEMGRVLSMRSEPSGG